MRAVQELFGNWGMGGELARSLQTLSDLQYQLGQENDSGAGKVRLA